MNDVRKLLRCGVCSLMVLCTMLFLVGCGKKQVNFNDIMPVHFKDIDYNILETWEVSDSRDDFHSYDFDHDHDHIVVKLLESNEPDIDLKEYALAYIDSFYGTGGFIVTVNSTENIVIGMDKSTPAVSIQFTERNIKAMKNMYRQGTYIMSDFGVIEIAYWSHEEKANDDVIDNYEFVLRSVRKADGVDQETGSAENSVDILQAWSEDGYADDAIANYDQYKKHASDTGLAGTKIILDGFLVTGFNDDSGHGIYILAMPVNDTDEKYNYWLVEQDAFTEEKLNDVLGNSCLLIGTYSGATEKAGLELEDGTILDEIPYVIADEIRDLDGNLLYSAK